MKKISKNKVGFTLLELVMVVAIIVILAGVMVLNITSYIQRAKNYSNSEEEGRSSAIGMISANESHLADLGFNRIAVSSSATGSI